MILSCAYGVVEYFQKSRPPTCSYVRRKICHKFLDSVLFSSAVRIFRSSVCMGFPFLTRTPNIWTLRYAHDKVVQNAFDTLENHMLLLFSFFSLKTLKRLLRRLTTGFWCHGRRKNLLKDRRIKFVLPH